MSWDKVQVGSFILASLSVCCFAPQRLIIRASLYKPLRLIIRRFLLEKYKEHEQLYRAYKELSPEELKMIKLNLKTQEHEPTVLMQFVDLISKLFFSIVIPSMVALFAVSSTILSFLKDNEGLDNDPNFDMPKNISGLFKIFTTGTVTLNDLMCLSASLLIFCIGYVDMLGYKKRKQKLHLTIIEEIIEDRKVI